MTQDELHNLRVLVIDDQPQVRTAVRGVLGDLGIREITEANSGRSALALVTQPGVQFDLILCDLRMPERDGIEAMRALAALGIESAVAIMSVEDDRVIEIAGSLASLQGLRLLGTIRKPVTAENLAPMLARVFREAPGSMPRISAPASDLEYAFRRNELQLFYQPQIHLRTGCVAGVEALVRWRHPTLGLVKPAEFMPALERSDAYMALLTQFSLEEGIAFAGRSRQAGRPLKVAINLSARAFERLDLPERIDALAGNAAVPTSDLTLEITETDVSRDVVRLADVALRLHLKGFRLSVDDFGMGQSGLAQLKMVPFNELKIDREFAAGCSKSSIKRSVVDASLALARMLHMTSVAEGVQDQDDIRLLDELGCDIVQGYFYARPMSEEVVGEWMAQWAQAYPASDAPTQGGP